MAGCGLFHFRPLDGSARHYKGEGSEGILPLPALYGCVLQYGEQELLAAANASTSNSTVWIGFRGQEFVGKIA